MSSIIVIGDPHFQISNMVEVKIFISKCTSYVEKLPNVHAVVVLGDVLHDHERLHSTVLNEATYFLKQLSNIAQTYVLVGNHDYINNSQFLTENHWMNGLKENKNITVVDKVIKETWDGKTVVMTPYVPNGRFVEALETCGNWKEADIIFAHQEIKGVKMGAITSEHGDEWAKDYPFVVSGHIHRNQRPKSNVYYPGSALQVAFGESEQNVIVELNLDNLDIKEIDLGLQRKKILYTDADVNSLKKIVKKVDKGGILENHKLKLCVDGTKEEFKALKKKAAFKKLKNKGVKIVYKRKRAAIKEENMKIVNAVGKHSTEGFASILKRIVQESTSIDLKNAYSLMTKN